MLWHYQKWVICTEENVVLSALCMIQALKSFCRAIHINPANRELRDDDLQWAAELVCRKASFDRENIASAADRGNRIAEVDAVAVNNDDDDCSQHTNDGFSHAEPYAVEMEQLLPNYVVIRD